MQILLKVPRFGKFEGRLLYWKGAQSAIDSPPVTYVSLYTQYVLIRAGLLFVWMEALSYRFGLVCKMDLDCLLGVLKFLAFFLQVLNFP